MIDDPFDKYRQKRTMQHTPALVLPEDKTYRAIVTNEKGEQKFETFKSRNMPLAFQTALDFWRTTANLDYTAKWRLTSVEEMGTR